MTAQLQLVSVAGPDGRRVVPNVLPLLGAAVRYPVGSAAPSSRRVGDDLDEHTARFGVRPRTNGRAGLDLVDTLNAIRLSGHGGSHFPAAAKWRANLDAGGGGVVVANGAESEPASAKDTALMQLRPHLVLDGIACAAEAVGAIDAVIWLHSGAHAARSAIVRALRERREAALPEPAIRVVMGPDHYLSGEATAIVNALSGERALPGFRTVRTAVSGVCGLPTLLHNVETLARTAVAARTGFDDHEGTTLLTVADGTARTVVEVHPSTTFGAAIESVAGWDKSRPPQAVLLGGFGGTWLAWESVANLPADENLLRKQGLSLGAGVLLPLPQDACGIAAVADIARFLAASSARQCGSCMFGLRALADVAADLAEARARRRDMARMHRYLDEILGRGACNHPDSSVRMIESALTTFADDVEEHRRRGRCLHGGSGEFFIVPEVG